MSPWDSTLEEEDADPALNDALRTNQLMVSMKLMRMNIEALELRVAKGLISQEDALDILGSRIHNPHIQVGREPGTYTSGEESVWEGIYGLNGKVYMMVGRIRADIMAEVVPMLAHVKQASLSVTTALVPH
jgi:hypothetical protein